MESEVFSAYETEIKLSKMIKESETYNGASGLSFNIDNSYNDKVYPKFIILAQGGVTLSSIQNDNQLIEFDNITLSNGQELILDFENQIYTIEAESIIDDIIFDGEDRLFLYPNEENTINLTFDGELDLQIEYNHYENNLNFYYVRSFEIVVNNRFNRVKPFSDTKTKKRDKTETIFSFNISKLTADWNLYETVLEDNLFRISYEEDHTNGDKLFNNYLVGVSFNDYTRGFNREDGLIITDINGEGTNLLQN